MDKNFIIGCAKDGIVVCEVHDMGTVDVELSLYTPFNKSEIIRDKEIVISKFMEELDYGIKSETKETLRYRNVSLRKIAEMMYESMDEDDILYLLKPNIYCDDVSYTVNGDQYLLEEDEYCFSNFDKIKFVPTVDVKILDAIRGFKDKNNLSDDEKEQLFTRLRDAYNELEQLKSADDELREYMRLFL